MRKEVPQLDNNLTKEEFLALIVDSFSRLSSARLINLVIHTPM